MYKVIILFLSPFLLALNIDGENHDSKLNTISEFDSLLKQINESKPDTIIAYYVDAALIYGVIVWQTDNQNNGIAFVKKNNMFKVNNIPKKMLYRSHILKQFVDSFTVLKTRQPY